MAETRRNVTTCLIHFKVENINDDVSSVVQQNNVATNYFLRQARRKVSLILGIPAADGFFIVMFIVMVGMLVIIITVVFIVSFAVSVGIILCLVHCGICADQEHTQCPGDHPLH